MDAFVRPCKKCACQLSLVAIFIPPLLLLSIFRWEIGTISLPSSNRVEIEVQFQRQPSGVFVPFLFISESSPSRLWDNKLEVSEMTSGEELLGIAGGFLRHVLCLKVETIVLKKSDKENPLLPFSDSSLDRIRMSVVDQDGKQVIDVMDGTCNELPEWLLSRKSWVITYGFFLHNLSDPDLLDLLIKKNLVELKEEGAGHEYYSAVFLVSPRAYVQPIHQWLLRSAIYIAILSAWLGFLSQLKKLRK